MKLLLTSSGLANQSIANALFELVGKKPEDTSLVFIPTAANVRIGDKDWFIEDLLKLKKQHFKSIDIADISALPEDIWRRKFETADVLFFEGGSVYHLMNWINKSGLISLLPELLKTKVYVGSSAGSMVTSKDLALKMHSAEHEGKDEKIENIPCLNFVDFYILPHLNSKHFPLRTEEYVKQAAQDIPDTIYALDDNSALKIVDGKVEVISEGKWFVINE